MKILGFTRFAVEDRMTICVKNSKSKGDCDQNFFKLLDLYKIFTDSTKVLIIIEFKLICVLGNSQIIIKSIPFDV